MMVDTVTIKLKGSDIIVLMVVIGNPITTITVLIGKMMNFIRTMIVIIHVIKIST